MSDVQGEGPCGPIFLAIGIRDMCATLSVDAPAEGTIRVRLGAMQKVPQSPEGFLCPSTISSQDARLGTPPLVELSVMEACD